MGIDRSSFNPDTAAIEGFFEATLERLGLSEESLKQQDLSDLEESRAA